MAIKPLTQVSAPPTTPAPFGVLSVATVVDDSSSHWRMGVEWEDLNPSEDIKAGILVGYCPVDVEKDLTGEVLVFKEAEGFVSYAPASCSPIGTTQADLTSYATAFLTATEEYRVQSYIGANILDTAAEVLGGYAVVDTLAAAETRARTPLGVGVLHMSAATATLLIAENLLVVTSGRLTTVLGTPVAVYLPGTSVALDAGQIGVTGPILVRRSEVFHASARDGDLLDRGRNDQYAIAERFYVVQTTWIPARIGSEEPL